MTKKLLLSISGISLCFAMVAQIPNNGFETWTNQGTYDTPNQWGNLNPSTAPSTIFTCIKGTPGYPGTAYIKLISKTIGPAVVPGIAVSGTINTSTYRPSKGFPISTQPQNLTGNWQYMAYGSDQGYIAVVLTKWNTTTNREDTVSKTRYNLPGMVMNWAAFTILLNYQSTVVPDTAMIILSSSGATRANNSYLYIDNLAFSGSVAGIVQSGEPVQHLNIFPVPAKDQLNIEFYHAKSESVKIQMIDILGNIISEITPPSAEGEYKERINTAQYAKGIYFMRVLSESGSSIRKIIIE